MKTATVLLSLPVVLFLFSCSAVTAKHGPVKTEQRTLANYTRIHASGAIDIDFTSGSASSASVEAPDDLMLQVITEVNNGTLEISMSGEVNNMNQPVKIHLTGSTLEAAEVSGACSLNMKSPLNGNSFRLALSGAANFRGTVYLKELNVNLEGASFAEIGGMTNEFKAQASGASTLNGDKLSTVKATVRASGASNATLRADSMLDAKASGASNISYTGNPPQLVKEIHGASGISNEK